MSSSMSGTLTYRRLRAPRRHGATLIEPGWADLPPLIDRNVELLASLRYDLQGQDLQIVRASARARTVALAGTYTAQYRDVDVPQSLERLYVAGHQPELFHPGVWFKNFFLGQLASQDRAVALNLIVDNDLARAMAVRCPTVLDGEVHATRVALDRPGGEIPYEQRAILDRDLFDSFERRLQAAVESWISDPVVHRLWPYARQAAGRRSTLGLVLAEARHRVEADWGVNTLELPLSQLCDGPEFRWFACHLLAHLPRFHQLYNAVLHEYRQLHRLRSHSHPVPDLAADGDGWIEAPLWIWSNEQPRRRRLFVRRAGRNLEVSDRRYVRLNWPLDDDVPAAKAVEAWGRASAAGVKIRPRALLTTMFARLCLGDVFVHGIGGAKYDQLTDELLRRFFRVEAPGFVTTSATVLLPVPRADVEREDVQRVERCLRELRYHPERHAPATPEVAELARAKRQWIEQEPPRGARRQRHRAIEDINRRLQPWVEPLRQRLEQERQELSVRLHDAQLLGSREFSLCLFPEQQLRSLLLDLSRAPS